jgi:hypothetical protein
MMTLYLSDATQEALETAVTAAQEWLQPEEGKLYRADDLKRAFMHWLESSIEELAEDAMFHAFQGAYPHTFNRRAFSDRLNQLQPTVILLPA